MVVANISDDSLQKRRFSLLIDHYRCLRHPLNPPYRGGSGREEFDFPDDDQEMSGDTLLTECF